MTTQISYPHLSVRSDGAVVILPAGVKVRMLVETYLGLDCNVKAVGEVYPQLTMGQIHAALAYYWDHKETLDAQIAEVNQHLEQAKMLFGNQPSRQELQARLAKR